MKNDGAEIINNIDVLIKDNKIIKIAKNIKINANKVIDATNKYVLPGFINCHTHIPMTLFKESGSKYTLQD
jgi:cytosine/adenosine deaminase-related metal-dependent hydrolase